MVRISSFCIAFLCLLVASSLHGGEASVFLPHSGLVDSCRHRQFRDLSSSASLRNKRHELRLSLHRSKRSAGSGTAMMIPGYGVVEQVFVGGFANFLSVYNLIVTARILLSWFPQAQGVSALQPVYAITDPFLNLFRGVVPPLFGLDFSPMLAFFLLNLVSNATSAIGAEIPVDLKQQQPLQHTNALRSRYAQLSRKYLHKRRMAHSVDSSHAAAAPTVAP